MMTKYEPDIADYLQREIDLLPFNECRVDILEAPNYNNPPMGCFSLDKEGNPVAQFYTQIIKHNIHELGNDILKYGGIQKYLQHVVRHECRHYMQYEYFKNHDIKYEDALDIESKFPYGEGPLEKDAKAFAQGVVRDLKVLCDKYFRYQSKDTPEIKKEEVVVKPPTVTMDQIAPTASPKKKRRRKK